MASVQKIFAAKDGSGLFVCSVCGREKSFDVRAFLNVSPRFDVRCTCGTVTSVLLEFRKFFRKKVRLVGACRVERSGEEYPIEVRDVSLEGVGFALVDRRNVPDIVPGDTVRLRFRLDNHAKSLVDRQGEVRTIRGEFIGVELHPVAYDRDLGAYLIGSELSE
jgi:hypothetical protein